MDESTLNELLAAIEARDPVDGAALRDLHLAFRAAHRPDAVADGVVDRRFWPVLRRLNVSRHPVDLVVAGYCAANHALMTACDVRVFNKPSAEVSHNPSVAPLPRRDELALRRVMTGLAKVALGGHQFSPNAIDLLAVLARWNVEPFRDWLGKHSGRRLLRALDRSVRTYVRVGTPIHTSDWAWFDEVSRIAETALRPPHTAASSSAAALRLARIVLLLHPEPVVQARTTPSAVVGRAHRIISRLQAISTTADDTADVLVRREAAWYCIESAPIVTALEKAGRDVQSPFELIAKLAAEEPDVFDDLRATAGLASAQPPAFIGRAAAWPANFEDLTVSTALHVHSWQFGDVQWLEVLDRWVPLDHVPRGPLRQLTRQIALPTLELLRELLYTPWSARARWIATTFRASGELVSGAVSDVLETMLGDREVLASPILAKRAAWTLGLLGNPKPKVIRTLSVLVLDERIESQVTADIVWALGDVLAAAEQDDQHVRTAIQALSEVARVGLDALLDDACDIRTGDIPADTGHVVRTQGALHAIGLQHDPRMAGFLETADSQVADALDRLDEARRTRKGKDRVDQFYGLALEVRRTVTWALNELDASVALSSH